jgi:nicotinamidase-related amidase
MDRLVPAASVLLVIDVQERLAAAMPESALARVVKSTLLLLEAARVTGASVLASEQYPKGLGPTIASIRDKMRELSVPAPLPKLEFDACADLAIARKLADLAPRSVVLVGMEAHVCVFQTARELVRRGYATYVVADAVCSRTEENRGAGLALSREAGAFLTVAEAVAFDWVGRAGTDAFKAVSKVVK